MPVSSARASVLAWLHEKVFKYCARLEIKNFMRIKINASGLINYIIQLKFHWVINFA